MRTEQRFASGVSVAPDFDAVLAPGAIVVLFGPSGAGKTTILRQIAGLYRPDAGTIAVGDETWCDIAREIWRPPQARRVGVVFQEPALFPHLSVAQNVSYGVSSSSIEQQKTSGSDPAAELATLLGIEDLQDRVPRQLSSGQAQRVALARALAPGPRLLLMDEPFAALDAPTRIRLRRDVRGLLQRTATPAILVTHDRTEALAMADRVVVVVDGRVRQSGATSDVFSRPADAAVAASLGIEAVLPGRIVSASDGLLMVSIAGVELAVADRGDREAMMGDVYACIRAEDVTLELRSSAHASTRNHLPAHVTAVAREGPIDRVSLNCGFPLDALITRRSCEELGLAPGSPVTAAIKATTIHLVARYS
jgi:molybdate transport system ATP-binding protein